MMLLTGQKIFDATQVLAAIINQKRALPSKGVYRVTKMHAKLFPEFTIIHDQRTAKIAAYDHMVWATEDGTLISAEIAATTAGASQRPWIPDDKMAEFVEWWKEIASVETDVNIDPIPIDQLSVDGQEGNISFAEFTILGDLVTG